MILSENITIPCGLAVTTSGSEALFDVIDDGNYEGVEPFSIRATDTNIPNLDVHVTLSFSINDPEGMLH